MLIAAISDVGGWAYASLARPRRDYPGTTRAGETRHESKLAADTWSTGGRVLPVLPPQRKPSIRVGVQYFEFNKIATSSYAQSVLDIVKKWRLVDAND